MHEIIKRALRPVKREIDYFRARIGAASRIYRRARYALRARRRPVRQIVLWSLKSREVGNYTYDLTPRNLLHLAHTVSVAVGVPFSEAQAVVEELRCDQDVKNHVIQRTRESRFRHIADARCDFGRRLLWYAIVRLTKPRVVVETGIDKGLGSVALCAALLRNAREGHPGRYYGTDINPNAGWLLSEPYSSVGEVLYGDSIESLERFDQEIDLFINDSDHSADYEYREYQIIASKLSDRAIVLGDNCHVTDCLARWSTEQDRKFLFFKEGPHNHWYPGAGVGISYR